MAIAAPRGSARDRFVCALAGALLCLAALRAEVAAPPEAPPEAQAPPQAPQKSEALEVLPPLSPEMQARLEQLQAAAARIRGLPLKRPVPMGQLDKASIRDRVRKLVAEELPPPVMGAVERTAKGFGLIPREMDLATYYPDLLSSQIAGYYDPKRKHLALLERPGDVLGPDLQKKLGPNGFARLIESVLLHELVHAIQDQHFDLATFGHDQVLSDAAIAKLSLLEGDATLAMYSYMLGQDTERLPGIVDQLQTAAANFDDLVAVMPDMPGGEELAKAPAWLRENLIFPYLQGLVFCVRLRQAGGRKLLDYAFARDPPRSSEQILHPEKYLAERDDPLPLRLPDLGAALAGCQRRAEGQWGEFNTRLLLMERLGPAAREQCERAAAGWGGDAFALLEKDGREAIVWWTEWDTEKDAAEFAEAAKSAFRAANLWSVLEFPAQRRRVVLCWLAPQLPPIVLGALSEAFEAARVPPAENKRLDLAALGITDADQPKPISPAEMLALLSDPAVREMMGLVLREGAGGWAKALQDAELTSALEKFLGSKEAQGLMAEVLKNPEFQKMVADMLGSQPPLPPGKVVEEAYLNEGLGLKLPLPKAPGWTATADPPGRRVGPVLLAELSFPGEPLTRVAVALQQVPFGMDVPLEGMAPFLEMAIKFQFQHYQQVKCGPVACGTRTGLELEFTGRAEGHALHVLQRMFLFEGKLLVVMGTASVEAWKERGAAIREAVEGLLFLDKKPAAPPPETKDEGRAMKAEG